MHNRPSVLDAAHTVSCQNCEFERTVTEPVSTSHSIVVSANLVAGSHERANGDHECVVKVNRRDNADT